MITRLAFAIGSLIWTAGDLVRSPLAPGQVRVVTKSFFRCSQENAIVEAMSFVSQFETQRALDVLQKNDCGLLAKGELATVDALAPSAGVACVRLQADRRCAWVPTNILR